MVNIAVGDKCPKDGESGIVDLEERNVVGLTDESACFFHTLEQSQ
jgi:hypothetical protein